MKKTLRSVLVLFVLCSLIFSTSCSLFENDGSGHTFKVSISSNPENLDPQIANDASSIAVGKNMFVGLLRLSNGRLTAGVAKDYLISDDGLKYTFYLDDRYKWKALDDFSADVTAHDFVFAFKRLFDVKTESPHAKDYYCISGSQAAHNGAIPLDEIGVKALDDYTLEFTLSYPNAEFLYLLAELPASPCNEQFFENCKGKYGLEAENIASNGAFYVRYWLYDKYNKSNYIRLSRNSYYSEINRVYPSGVTYFIHPSSAEKLKAFTDETTDVLIDDSGFSKLLDSEYQLSASYSSTYGIVFNLSNEVLAQKEVRELFSMAINRVELDDELPKNLTSAYSIIPPETIISGSAYESGFDKTLLEYNKITAQYRWNFLLSEAQKSSLYNINVLVSDDFLSSDKLRLICDSWYNAFDIHFGIEVVNDADYAKRISSGDYDIAFVSLTPDNGDIFGYLSDFGSADEYGISLNEVIKIENKLGKYNTLTAKYSDFITAEKKIIEDYLFLPICHGLVYNIYSEDIADFEYDVLKNTIIFENAKAY